MEVLFNKFQNIIFYALQKIESNSFFRDFFYIFWLTVIAGLLIVLNVT